MKPKRVIIWTDYGLDHFLAIDTAKKFNVKVWCIQHGLFPADNNFDLDGLDSDVNVVSSIYQSKILKKATYSGKVVIFRELFGNSDKVASTANVDCWNKSGRSIIFVGAGYNHSDFLENKIIELMESLTLLYSDDYKIIYRPHPRDNHIKLRLKYLGVDCIYGLGSSCENSENFVFLGIKSTFLIEAQNAGKLVFLITGNEFPRYFEYGEISNELDFEKIDQLSARINSHIQRGFIVG